MISPKPAPERAGTAAALRRLADRQSAPRFSIDDLLAALGDQGFGLLIFALALPNAVPGPLIPGFSVPFALGIAVLGLQLALGLHAPRLPRQLRRLSMEQRRFRRLIDRAEPWLRRLERWLRPRPSPLTAGPGERLVGVALIALSVVLALPVPLGNTPIALSIILIALGQLEEDGVALLAGIAAGLAASLWNAFLIFAGAELFEAAAHIH
ncbi:MAG TPA: exopolysaccharide biosynthesis protein [Stellaceae bacterium]|nr:exopolysaccharide biosynthesis protein [Stellaceae bacterium]